LTGGISGSNTLTKTGGSSFTIGGSNTYTGLTTVSAGTLIFDGTLNNSTSGVNVDNGAMLRGIGTISRALSGSGTVFPGNTTPLNAAKGTLTANSANLSAGTLRVRVHT